MKVAVLVAALLTVGSACSRERASDPVSVVRCVDGRFTDGVEPSPRVVDDCRADQRRCDEDLGCVGCIAGAVRCADAQHVEQCTDGATWAPVATCSATEACDGRACVDACALAAAHASYEGCEYDAVSTLNSLLAPGFHFGLVVGNDGDAPADVHVTRGGVDVATFSLPARSVHQLALPFVDELSHASSGSSIFAGAAYHVTASRPVALYQYNPLEFRNDDMVDCIGGCLSYSNDASVLLPTSALGTEYLVANVERLWPGPGFVTVVAHAPTRLDVTPHADIAPTRDGRVVSHPAGEPFSVELAAGEVLTLVAPNGSLDGSELRSDVPVLVISGADCTYIPVDYPACDHLEEVMLPVPSWGTTAVAAAPRAVDGEPYVLRIMSGDDQNSISITGVPHPIVRDRGRSFELLVTGDVVVRGTKPLLVMQYLVGTAYFDRRLAANLGDPSMGVAPFAEQFRTTYGFAVPDTYTIDFAAIVTSDPSTVRLDAAPIDGWTPIDDGAFFAVRVAVDAGAHALQAPAGAGLTLYGLAPATSYLLPGGLNVEPLR